VDHYETEIRAKAMSIHLAGLVVGMIAGGACAGHLGERFGWRANFVLLGLSGLVIAAIADACCAIELPPRSSLRPSN
jgi:predicted MFS family arabinose efflux permease